MEGRISRGVDPANVIASGMQAVADGILKVADSQQKDAIENAIKSFDWAASDGKRSDTPEWSAFTGESVVQIAGFTDSPREYLTRASEAAGQALSAFSDMAPMDQVLANLRNSGLNFQQGVSAFMGSGIVEALASLKLNTPPKGPLPAIPPPLDELLPPDKMKNADPAMLQASVRAVSQMFTTLKNMLNARADMNVNMLRFMRA